MPIKSGARQRYLSARYGITLRHRYDEVGLPCRKTMGAPLPVSTYAMLVPSTLTVRRGCRSATVVAIVAWVRDMTHTPLPGVAPGVERVVGVDLPSDVGVAATLVDVPSTPGALWRA